MKKTPKTFTTAIKEALRALDDGEPGLAVELIEKIIPTVSGKVGRLVQKARDEADIGSPEQAENLLWLALYEVGHPVSAVIGDSSPENDERLLQGKPVTDPVIVVSVSGGVVDAVYLNSRPIRIIVADFDNWKAGSDLCSAMLTEPLSEADDLILENPLVVKAAK